MKKLLLLFFIVVLAGGCEKGGDGRGEASKAEESKSAASSVFTREPEGFRDIKWGADISGIVDMKPGSELSEYAGDEAYYVRENEDLSMDGVALKTIIYKFTGGRFSEAIAVLEGEGEEALKVKGTLFEIYGPVGPFIGNAPKGTGIEMSGKQYMWKFKDGSIAFLLNESGPGSMLLFSANPDG